MDKRCWITWLIHKNVCLIKEDLVISQIWNKSIIRTTLWRVHLLTIKLYVIIAIKMIIWRIDVQLKEMCIMESNVFGFRKELNLTLKDPRVLGYQSTQLKYFFCRYHKQGMVESSLMKLVRIMIWAWSRRKRWGKMI